MVFCTEFLDGWWSWVPLRRSCVRCGWCRAAQSHGTIPNVKNISIKLPCSIKLAFYIISWRRCTVKQSSSYLRLYKNYSRFSIIKARNYLYGEFRKKNNKFHSKFLNIFYSKGAKFFHVRKEGYVPSWSLLISIDLSNVSVTRYLQNEALQLNRKQR